MCAFAVEACALGATELSAEGAHLVTADLECRHAVLNEAPWFF